MKLIIDIPEEDYAETMYRKQHTPRDMDWADKIIANGTLLEDVKEPKNGERFSCPNCGFKADWFIPLKEDNTKESK